jgi:hypothetical protein
MWQQGQVFKLKAKRVDGQPLWAYRYRLEGRGLTRPQVGGFATRADALKALENVLARLGPSGRAATMTLGELVDELCVPETGFAVGERRLLAERAVRPVRVVCAGINRRGEGEEGALRRRSSDPRWPRVMRLCS